MLDFIENLDFRQKGIYLSVAISLLVIFMSGIFFGVTYFALDQVHTTFLTTDCVIDNNALVTSCQELFELSLYPLLLLKELLIWMSYFFIFGLVISLLVLGYRAGTTAVLLGIHISFVGLVTYSAILFSNAYLTFLDNATFRDFMVPFTVYNQIMINFPWFMFFVSLFSVMLGIVNFQKSSINTPDGEELDY